jgi:hypothetical protein
MERLLAGAAHAWVDDREQDVDQRRALVGGDGEGSSSPPSCSGSEVVAAAAIAPDGACTSSLSASALRITASRQGPS